METNAAIKDTAAGYFARNGSEVPSYRVVMNHFGMDKDVSKVPITVTFEQYYSVFLKEHNRLSMDAPKP